MSNWEKKKSVHFQIFLVPREGHVKEFWPVIRKVKCGITRNAFVFLLQMLCFLGFPFSPSSCLDYGRGI